MAGIVPPKVRGRKQWTLHDGPRGSLRRLRNQLASDGCPESQVVLAKQLFDEDCELETDRKENERQGVYWLIKASEQGNREATEMLERCLLTGRGITDHNYLDVKFCIDMSQDEKVARNAAREMFTNLSNGEDFITTEQLQKRMLQIQNESLDRELIDAEQESDEQEDWTNRFDMKTEKLTEDHLVAAATNYCHGQLPLVNRVLVLNEPHLNALDHIPLMQRSIFHPILALRILFWKLVYLFSTANWFRRPDLPWLLLFISWTYYTDNWVLVIPTIVFYVTLVLMILSTFKMLQTKRDFHDFQIWGRLFLTYSGGSLNAEQSEIQFLRNNLKPYGHFFLSLLLNLLIYPFISERWIPQSEITFISFCFTFMTLFHLSSPYDYFILLSFAVNVLAKYPYETDPVVAQGWRFLDLKAPTFASYVVGYGIEFCLNFRLIFYIIIPILFFYLASRQNFTGTYKYLIPHCVTLSWLQMNVIHSQGATMFGLIRTTLALVGFVMFLPLVGLTTILLPILAVGKWLVATNVIIFVIASILSVLGYWYLNRNGLGHYITVTPVVLIPVLALSKWDLTDRNWFFVLIFTFALFLLWLRHHSFVQICATLFTICLLLDSVWQLGKNDSSISNYEEDLSWDDYQEHCYHMKWEEINLAQTQLNCRHYVHTPISWTGYVNEVRLKSVYNPYQSLLNKLSLPKELSAYLQCYFGNVIDYQKQNCNLNSFNVYEYEIPLKIQSGIWGKTAEVFLIADHNFGNFTLDLKPNDKIWFKGILVDNEMIGSDGLLGGMKPHIRLHEIGCLICRNDNLTTYKTTNNYNVDFQFIFEKFCTGIKFVLNVLFNPVIVFK